MEKVYLQIYSLRDVLKDDFVGAIEKVGGIGYTGVEFAGMYGGLNAEGMKALLKRTGLSCISAHIGLDQAEQYIDYIAALGGKYIICPSARFDDRESALRVAEELNRIGGKCAAAGMKYGYHNHTTEFRKDGDEYLEEIIIKNTDPAKVAIQLDVGWCVSAGVDAVAFINKYAGRFEMIHAKEAGEVLGTDNPVDFSKVKFDEQHRPVFTPEQKALLDHRQQTNVPSGKGIVDWKAVRKAADAQGAKAYIVEREWDYCGDIFRCVKEDWEYLRTV